MSGLTPSNAVAIPKIFSCVDLLGPAEPSLFAMGATISQDFLLATYNCSRRNTFGALDLAVLRSFSVPS